MQWTDEAIVLSARRQGEGSLTLSLLTRAHGRHRGLARGGQKSRQRGLFEPGSRVVAAWQARLAEHLGLLRLEPVDNVAALLLDDPLRLACLEAATSLTEAALPEREPHPVVHAALGELLDHLARDAAYAASHLRFELTLLAELGFGLDLAACAVTGTTAELAYVSPKTGRAVSVAAGAAYKDRLLVLPRLLGGIGGPGGDVEDLLAGLALAGFFLDRHLFPPGGGRVMPPARARYVERLGRLAI